MKDEEFDQIVKKLEEQAERDPKGYVWHVVKLALLGYVYIFGVILFLLLMVVLLLWLLLVVHAWILIKFSFLFLIAAWVVLKSLWVKYGEPEGIPLDRKHSPVLFDLIAETRRAAGGPPIHAVLLDENFNCGIMQVPKLGMFGWYKNVLILGMPLLQSVDLPQFKAILAHEMGHLSDQHGKVGAWVYHVRKSWQQTWVNLAYQSSVGVGLVKRFAQWFVPMFDAHTMVLMRQHEYAADRIALNVSGAEIACQALIQTALKTSYLSDEFWDGYWKQIEKSPTPPNNTLAQMRTSLSGSIDQERALELLQKNWAKHDSADTHPALSERVRALLPDKDWSDPKVIANEALSYFHIKSTAAEQLFESNFATLETLVEARWSSGIEKAWVARHQVKVQERQRLIKIESEAQTRELTKDEMLELASLTITLEDAPVAIEKYRQLLAVLPEQAELHYGLGILLLDQKDSVGITELETSAKLKPLFGRDATAAIATYLRERGREAEADVYQKQSSAYADQLEEASFSLNNVNNSDIFEEHKLSSSQLNELLGALAAVSLIKTAHIVAKKTPEIVGGHQHILVFTYTAAATAEQQEGALSYISQFPQVSGFYLMSWSGAPKALTNACKNFVSANIYEKGKWTGYPVRPISVAVPGVPVPASILLAQEPDPGNFFVRHKGQLILGGIIVVFLFAIFSTTKASYQGDSLHALQQSANPPDNPPEIPYAGEVDKPVSAVKSDVDFGPYMKELQRQIKDNWRPPKTNKSASAMVEFTVLKNGQLGPHPSIMRSSGSKTLDAAALVALKDTAPFKPLPAGAPNEVTVQFTFDYRVHR